MRAILTLAAHIAIDSVALLLWYRFISARISLRTRYLPHLQPLIDYYVSQCQPIAIPWPLTLERSFDIVENDAVTSIPEN